MRVALVYDRSVAGRRYESAEAETGLLTAFLSFVDAGRIDGLAEKEILARGESRRHLVRALLDDPGARTTRPALTAADGEFCHVVRDLSDLRPAELRRALAGLLAEGRPPPRCLAHSLFFNAELRADDTAILRQLAGSEDPQSVLALVRHLVNVGRFSEALTLCAYIPDGQLRGEVERAVISSRQVASLGLPAPQTSKAVFAALVQRSGAERLLFGSLLAAQAAPEFWAEHAAAIEAFLATASSDATSATLRDMWARQILARGGYAIAARVWAKAPSLRPAPEFVAAYFFLRDDQPAVDGPNHGSLNGLSLGLRRLAAVARAVRLPDGQSREVSALFRALLDSYPGRGREPRLGTLDAAFLAVAAARVEALAAAGSGRTR